MYRPLNPLAGFSVPKAVVISVLRASEHAVLSADYRPDGEVRVHVTYTDPPGRGASKPLKLLVGTYEHGEVDSRNERQDVLDEIEKSYPGEWKSFLSGLPEAIKVAEVMVT